MYREVHNDVYKVIKHWVNATDSAEKLLDMWTSCVESFFGLPLRPKEEQVHMKFDLSVNCHDIVLCLGDCIALASMYLPGK